MAREEGQQAVAVVWFKQAERDLKAARKNRDDSLFDLAAQQARSASEKVLKAEWILLTGDEPPDTHSVSELARLVGRPQLVEETPPAARLGFKSHQEALAERCILIAEKVMEEVRPKFSVPQGLLR